MPCSSAWHQTACLLKLFSDFIMSRSSKCVLMNCVPSYVITQYHARKPLISKCTQRHSLGVLPEWCPDVTQRLKLLLTTSILAPRTVLQFFSYQSGPQHSVCQRSLRNQECFAMLLTQSGAVPLLLFLFGSVLRSSSCWNQSVSI